MFRKITAISRIAYRGVILAWTLSTFLIRAAFIKKLNKNESMRNKKLALLMHKCSKRLLKVFKVNIRTAGADALSNTESCLILSNHLSYVDILFISSVRPSLFLSHTGIQKEPLVGWLAEGGGTLFVDRSTRSKLQMETARLSGLLADGNTVTLFPEGTTGNGDSIMTFHSAFVTAAVNAGVDVLPICIQYEKLNGEPITRKNRHNIFIYDKMQFIPHICSLYRNLVNADIRIEVGKRISTAGRERKEIAGEVREWMIGVFKPVED